ncbi:MAG: signal peptidase II [Acidobacteria bacterium]|nr:signal peptidase II [Acidobacteriota bacterium]
MSRSLAFSIAAVVFAFDRVTKWIIRVQVSAFDRHPVIPGFFDIVHSENRGAAFGLLSEASPQWRALLLVGVSLLALGIVGGMLWNASRLDRPTFYGLALIFGGALGNLFDRILHGQVTDFLEFYVGEYVWPAFNVADSAITIGCGLLLLSLVKPRRQVARTSMER